MKICKTCGAENSDGSIYCVKCGEKLNSSGVDMAAMKDTFSNAADKTLHGAKDLVGKFNTAVNTTLENQKAKANEEAQQQISRAQQEEHDKKTVTASGTSYMSSTELWSWLQKSSKRQHFYTEEENTLTQKEYIEQLDQKLIDNHVPANVQARDIQWDRSNVKQHIYFVQPVSDAVNPLSCLVQFNHVGKFTFVEEKTFITPPDLPEVPEKQVIISDELKKRAQYLPVGILLALVGLALVVVGFASVGVIFIAGGGVFAWFGYGAQQKLKALEEHNRKCIAQEKAWSDAWSNWEDSIFLHSFQENVNGQISRIYDAVFECIKQLNEELFSQKDSAEQEESQSMNELEQLIARRKDSYR